MAEEEGLSLDVLGIWLQKVKISISFKKKNDHFGKFILILYPDIPVNPENATGSGVDTTGENLRNVSHSICNSPVSPSMEVIT